MSLAIEVDDHPRDAEVVATLSRINATWTTPKFLFVDNGSEFSGQNLRRS